MNMKKQKQELRSEIKERISLLSSRYCEQADQKICNFATSLPEYMSSETIFCYVGTINEINTVPIINDAMRKGKRVGIPKCVDKGIMEVYHIKTLEKHDQIMDFVISEKGIISIANCMQY